ncbi:MAG: hypothetical protein H0T89_10200, partial [Deltaproteobacteria bacterium]|nr:hypothetical protein [Deltaproteobacteria bacterium]
MYEPWRTLGLIVLALFVLATCSGSKKPAGTWIERDLGSEVHATHEETGAAAVSITFDPTTLTAAQIDQLDEPTVMAALHRMGDAAPAARLALRAARLAHHRGDAAIARSRL